MLRGICGPRRDEVTGDWRKLHNEELHFFSSPNINTVIKWRRVRWAGHMGHIGTRESIQGLGGSPEGKKPLGRRQRRRG